MRVSQRVVEVEAARPGRARGRAGGQTACGGALVASQVATTVILLKLLTSVPALLVTGALLPGLSLPGAG